ncbi:universal stress protein [Nitrosospira sp. Is2]|uniref:universal stress protein n=1 Tax=Nitrosospira sp. Is2 TaxID=3080532 RepID=UPI00295406DD|nr:universal stress protein [Nitrosospira sp. Is2]WON73156.1 universal stress protein [Nitrosospira sp. Is2]
MAMYQRILVPIDGSPTSQRAFEEALGLAGQAGQGTQLELLHVVEIILFPDSEIYFNYAELQKIMRSSGEKILAEAEKMVRQAGVAVQKRLLQADGERIANVIVEEARRWPADLIVIGTHGRSGFSRILFGSVAEGVVHTADVPVLLIRGA